MAKSRSRYQQGTTTVKTHEQLKHTKLIWWYGKPMNVSFLIGMPYRLVAELIDRERLYEAVLKEDNE